MKTRIKTIFIIVGLFSMISCNKHLDKQVAFSKAKELTDKKDYKEANKILCQIIDQFPDFDSAYVERGYVNIGLNKIEGALDDVNKAIELNRNNVSAYFVRARAYTAIQKNELAIKDYTHVINLGDKDYLGLCLQERGILFDMSGQQDKAIKDFHRLYQIDSTNIETLTGLGLLYARKKENAKALDLYNKALTINPKYSDALYKRALLNNEIRNIENALEDITQAIINSPKTSTYYVTRSLIYRDMKNFQLALNDLNKAIELDPDNAVAYENRGYLKAQDLKDKDGGEKDLQKAKTLYSR
jgi:tetratricopeptide (TPR) repeat protein